MHISCICIRTVTGVLTVWLEVMLPVLNIHGLSVFCIHFIETLLRSVASYYTSFTDILTLRKSLLVHSPF